MREIRFRAWDGAEMQEHTLHDIWVSASGRGEPKTTLPFYNNPLTVIMQFTGLHDKNGNKIYEGDVLLTVHKSEPKKILWKVIWAENEDGYMTGWMVETGGENYILDRGLQEKGKVIGNIYENPELLEKGQVKA